MRVRPWTVRREHALAFVEATHRRRPRVQGAMWAVCVRDDHGTIVGTALVGWPAAAWTNEEIDTLCVLRAAGWVDGGTTDGGEWDRPGRRRRPAVCDAPKRRWWAPGSRRAPKCS